MVVHAFYPVGETRVQREAEALLKRGYEVDVLCLRRKGDRLWDGEKSRIVLDRTSGYSRLAVKDDELIETARKIRCES